MAEPQHSPDGHHIIVDGRRWRASDPSIPATLRAELVDELMRARRLVRTEGDRARPFVQDAKEALGERGEPWWEPTEAGRRQRLAATIRTLLRHRDGSTMCPSDAARVVGGDQWRDLMGAARDVAVELTARDEVRVQQGGVDVDPASATGPIRLAAGPTLER